MIELSFTAAKDTSDDTHTSDKSQERIVLTDTSIKSVDCHDILNLEGKFNNYTEDEKKLLDEHLIKYNFRVYRFYDLEDFEYDFSRIEPYYILNREMLPDLMRYPDMRCIADSVHPDFDVSRLFACGLYGEKMLNEREFLMLTDILNTPSPKSTFVRSLSTNDEKEILEMFLPKFAKYVNKFLSNPYVNLVQRQYIKIEVLDKLIDTSTNIIMKYRDITLSEFVRCLNIFRETFFSDRLESLIC